MIRLDYNSMLEIARHTDVTEFLSTDKTYTSYNDDYMSSMISRSRKQYKPLPLRTHDTYKVLYSVLYCILHRQFYRITRLFGLKSYMLVSNTVHIPRDLTTRLLDILSRRKGYDGIYKATMDTRMFIMYVCIQYMEDDDIALMMKKVPAQYFKALHNFREVRGLSRHASTAERCNDLIYGYTNSTDPIVHDIEADVVSVMCDPSISVCMDLVKSMYDVSITHMHQSNIDKVTSVVSSPYKSNDIYSIYGAVFCDTLFDKCKHMWFDEDHDGVMLDLAVCEHMIECNVHPEDIAYLINKSNNGKYMIRELSRRISEYNCMSIYAYISKDCMAGNVLRHYGKASVDLSNEEKELVDVKFGSDFFKHMRIQDLISLYNKDYRDIYKYLNMYCSTESDCIRLIESVYDVSGLRHHHVHYMIIEKSLKVCTGKAWVPYCQEMLYHVLSEMVDMIDRRFTGPDTYYMEVCTCAAKLCKVYGARMSDVTLNSVHMHRITEDVSKTVIG